MCNSMASRSALRPLDEEVTHSIIGRINLGNELFYIAPGVGVTG